MTSATKSSASHSVAAPLDCIRIRGARQNNLQNIDVDIPLGAITAVTGVSGSGKSSLAFDTLYAEGQRRYVESFSPYARQFMDRMDRPDVDAVDGVLPAVAIDQKNAIRASRSTVGTVTELTDFFKLWFARSAVLHCEGCGVPVVADSPVHAAQRLMSAHPDARALVVFSLAFSAGQEAREAATAAEWLRSKGFRRVRVAGEVWTLEEFEGQLAEAAKAKKAPPWMRALAADGLDVVVDRVALAASSAPRLVEALEAAYQHGGGKAAVWVQRAGGGSAGDGLAPDWTVERLSQQARHCAACDRSYPTPVPNHFSYNSPLGACERCNGFGAVIDLDLDLVVPDTRVSLADGAIRPWNTPSTEDERSTLATVCEQEGIPMDVPWAELDAAQRHVLVEGDKSQRWYGIRGWFRWQEGRTYKMHVRVLLSRYRAYVPCPDCEGTRFRAHARLYKLAGASVSELYELPLRSLRAFVQAVAADFDEAAVAPVVTEVRDRLRYLDEVGVGYLTLNRQSRTLSGGEVQRVNLTTAIGSALVNTLYVLDEPSIGLHARDNERLLAILERLRANRNTIVLVEHDDAIISRVDHVIDMGPGPGQRGGQVVYAGPPSRIAEATSQSTTARYLVGGADPMPAPPRRAWEHRPALRVIGAREHNLKGVNLTIPLATLTVVSGVSGSGKSTLIEDVLHRGLQRLAGKPVDRAGAHDAIEGYEAIDEVVMVDQSPVGTTPRSNPATYVKVYGAIRDLFAETDRASALGLTSGSFSFNSKGGRCDACEGNGFEKIEMQFLSDQYVTCDRCAGRRFKADVLSVRWRGQSIDEVLELTVDQALRTFDDEPTIVRGLAAVQRVGLGYLRIGQPLNTLSGGESQRLKLANHLSLQRSENTLFLLDEPTTGLHLDDVRHLITNLHALVDAGNTVVVIEHHLDLIEAADYVVDLGPEGGDEGGRIVAAGSPDDIVAAGTHTGVFLQQHRDSRSQGVAHERGAIHYLAPRDIWVRGARVNNLQNIDVRIPRDELVVITGPSGSGKSSLAFDVLFAEGQRRFVDCLSPYARQYVQQAARPDIDELLGVPPTVCISQRTSRAGRKSTVATVTEIYHYLRLVYARIGVQHCVKCGAQVSGLTAADLAASIARRFDGREITVLAPAIRGRKGWHKPIFERAVAEGHTEIRVDGATLDPRKKPELERFREHDIEYVIARWTVQQDRLDTVERYIDRALQLGEGTLYVLPKGNKKLRPYSTKSMCVDCGVGYDSPDPRTFSFHSSAGACKSCRGTGTASAEDEETGEDTDTSGRLEQICATCEGSRLNPVALAVRIGGRNIAQTTGLTPQRMHDWLESLHLSERDATIVDGARAEILRRCQFLVRVGLDHLQLSRSAHTLSGGEAQRVRLGAQLSAELRGVLYVLDEPTIGLHPVDNDRLLDALQELVARGNSVVVVEHDDETIRRSTTLIEMGPQGGRLGGTVVEFGPTQEVLAHGTCLTAQELRAGGQGRAVRRDRPAADAFLRIRDASHHNLQSVDVDIPLHRMTVVTGVSGSGKSSLVREVLSLGMRAIRRAEHPPFGRIEGAEKIEFVREIDQTPIGKTPASTPATYVGLYDHVRKLFASLPDSRARGYNASRFSFNTKVGRCHHCKGQGQVRHEMSFLPDVYTPCDVCEGRRFDEETLSIRYRGATISDVLQMTVDEALELFTHHKFIARALQLLTDTGLGYLQLGQPSHTLSGGEAQRIKLVEELQKDAGRGALYLMDEPSTGLHMNDLQKLIEVMQRLVDRGDTVILIEHNLDVVASADWLIDMGPGGGEFGGHVVAMGPFDQVRDHQTSCTARYLRAHLRSPTTKRQVG